MKHLTANSISSWQKEAKSVYLERLFVGRNCDVSLHPVDICWPRFVGQRQDGRRLLHRPDDPTNLECPWAGPLRAQPVPEEQGRALGEAVGGHHLQSGAHVAVGRSRSQIDHGVPTARLREFRDCQLQINIAGGLPLTTVVVSAPSPEIAEVAILEVVTVLAGHCGG